MSMEAVAKQAGVGVGTLYRHFPNREHLFDAVYRREMQQLSGLADQLKSEATPVEALRRWLRFVVEFVATKKGMSAALELAAHSSLEHHTRTFDRLTKALSTLLDRAVRSDEVRSDISAEELLRTLVGICNMHDQPDWQESVLRLIDVFVDGLRVRATVHRSVMLASRPDHTKFKKGLGHPRRGARKGLNDDRPKIT